MELNPQGTPTTPIEQPVDGGGVTPTPIVPQPIVDDGEIKGLTQAEYNDPNQIQITISDKTSPIVVLFGPPACGKTMSLVRLTRYLKEKGYKVEPISTFRPAADTHYSTMCERFNNDVNSRKAADSTKSISFMLVKVLDERGLTICQILEAPGEYYFNPQDPSAPFPSYVNAIVASHNRKIWCYMVEPAWKDQPERVGYVDKIKSLKRSMRKSDKAVFVFNKIDMTSFVLEPGRINEKAARKEVKELYPGIFEPFRTVGVFGTSDNFKFVPFHTGFYSKDPSGGQFFDAGDEVYPEKLWKTILKLVRG